jgi:hypothetical protein
VTGDLTIDRRIRRCSDDEDRAPQITPPVTSFMMRNQSFTLQALKTAGQVRADDREIRAACKQSSRFPLSNRSSADNDTGFSGNIEKSRVESLTTGRR